MSQATMPTQGVASRCSECRRCGKVYQPYERSRRVQRFCCDSCRYEAWQASKACGVARLPQAPEIKRQAAKRLLILGRLQDGPATGYELFAAGGGFRYTARLKELRDAGHFITTENLGGGVFRYTLVQP